MNDLVQMAVREGLLSQDNRATIVALAEVRNRVAHGVSEPVSQNDARFYVNSVSRIARVLTESVSARLKERS